MPDPKTPRFLHRFKASIVASMLAVFAITAEARELSVQEAVAQVQRDTNGGKVLSVQTLTIGKRKVYRIKVLTHDGQVRVVQIQAEQ
jgi:uncharacterized membrane protein YkoI